MIQSRVIVHFRKQEWTAEDLQQTALEVDEWL
jgi:hypothetical protein